MNLKHLFDRKPDSYSVHYEEQQAASVFADHLLTLLPPPGSCPVVFAFIGTDRSTGDSLGPLVGTLLEEKKVTAFHMYGTLENPVHAVNLTEKLALIEKEHEHPFIVGADACLGRLKSVGHIQIGKGPVKPGAGVNKQLPAVGEAHITGIVNVSGFMEFFVLQNTRLHLVMSMARVIADGIAKASIRYSASALLQQSLSQSDQDLKRQAAMYAKQLFKKDIES
ncbi:spore protease YyaC [Pseudobacillus badius]|uniref:spore protease YyaC n=1 Tax=Bacillus badius TaxID=1455 RepID=UPI0007B068BD|nr:spore protease YyaC [Bacillus badius]KZN98285.1 spore protease YyaC [Bacillus badius]MED0666768.1 spore protease YyaC [Bacillus badius]OCS82653.1 spore protease YyaC [Bacillus badius]OVE51358.1 spore protease YyaC [Bacillus badius]TDW02461.1 putative sporulation protein YyaC [Bacillus badius]